MSSIPYTPPDFLQNQDVDTIYNRMKENLPEDIDTEEGSFFWDVARPVAIEKAEMVEFQLNEVLKVCFPQWAYGEYLDLHAEMVGLQRRPAVPASGYVTVTGQPGTYLPAGTELATPAVGDQPSIIFRTKEALYLDESGTGTVEVEATTPGTIGNVAANTITLMVQPVPGITSITNPEPTTGGTEEEDDESLRMRYFQRVRAPSTGGNKADYINWALEVPGVGGVSVIPVRDGPGTVSVAIINTNKEPADQTLVDKVQNYIAPPWVNEVEAEAMALGGYGASIDDTGDSVKLVYDAQGEGTVTHAGLEGLLQQPGIWQARTRVKADDSTGETDLLQIGVWNVSATGWCKTKPGGTTDALIILKASDLATTFDDKIVEFYWNGQDQIELRITRLTTDTTTTVWVDRVVYRSTFSKSTGEGKAPVGARVTVEPATAVLINVSATLIIAPGYNADSVKAAVKDNIAAYIRSLAFSSDNDVRYVRIGQAILDTPGIIDYQNLTVNGGTANVTIGAQEVAVLGTVNFE